MLYEFSSSTTDTSISGASTILERAPLVTRPSGLGDHTLELINLPLGSAESSKLLLSAIRFLGGVLNAGTYSSLCQLSCALVLTIPEEFDDTAFVRSQTDGAQV